jgi:hypothetical protein
VGDVGPIALRVFAVGGGCVAFVWACMRLVRFAKRGGKGMQALGMAMMLFGWGNMRDPRNDPVKEAQDGRIRKGESSGDPLDR